MVIANTLCIHEIKHIIYLHSLGKLKIQNTYLIVSHFVFAHIKKERIINFWKINLRIRELIVLRFQNNFFDCKIISKVSIRLKNYKTQKIIFLFKLA